MILTNSWKRNFQEQKTVIGYEFIWLGILSFLDVMW